MSIKNRHFIYRNSIRIGSDDYDLAIENRKTLTIRLGTAEVDESVKYLTDGTRKLTVEFTQVLSGIKYKALTDEHAKLEGYSNLIELQTDLRKYYGDIDPDQPITLIYFKIKHDKSES